MGASTGFGAIANGGGCLAAQIVSHFKSGMGQFYLCPLGERNCGQEFTYAIEMNAEDDGALFLTAFHGDKCIFSGTPSDFLKSFTTPASA